VKIDAVTKRWIRNAADERAASRGFRFDESRGQNNDRTGIIDFVEDNLRLYEGEYAGQLVKVMPWQYEFWMRLFCWVRMDELPNGQHRELRRFRKAGVWVPKKNGKTPTAAMTGLYLFCADGEPGQKVFSAAKDGRQARIMHTHAIKMVEQSPALMAECQINRSPGKEAIIHVPTDSVYSLLAGDNIAGQEGINGSVIIDECHVVDNRLAKVLEYAGASRPEPIQLEVSTAGDNPMGYGKKQFDYGKTVDSGVKDDDRFLFIYYGADQNATDEECMSPELQEAANPAIGHILRKSELMEAAKRAQKSISDFAVYKKYRLNIWQQSSNPWLKLDDWVKCGREFTLDDMQGRDCTLGLDLSKTRDMSAFVLVFSDQDEDNRYWQWPEFWLPEDAALENAHLADYPQWHQDGHMHYCEGRTIDQRDIRQRIEDVAKIVNITSIVYDPAYAEELTKQLAEDLGIERVAFKQTIMYYMGPTATYEGLVIDGRLHHPNHPILNWQAGHIHVKTDVNNNKRPVKPDNDDHRKIDGMVAGIMSLGVEESNAIEPSAYEDEDVPMYADDIEYDEDEDDVDNANETEQPQIDNEGIYV